MSGKNSEKKMQKKVRRWIKFLVKPDLPKNNPTDINLFKNKTKSKAWIEYLKFFLIPTYQPKSLSVLETELIQQKTQRSTFRKMLTPLTITGGLIVVFMVSIAVFAPWLSPYEYKALSLDTFAGAFAPPSKDHILGTTIYGRDILGRIIFGARESLTLGISALLISYGFGTVFGLIAAYFGGRVDTIIMRIFDLLMTLPGLVIVLLFGAIFGRTMDAYMIAFGILMIPENARLIRSQVLIVKQSQYIDAAKISGAKSFRIMFKHILPNAIAPMIISASVSIGAIILSITALTYLGMGEPNVVECGGDVNIGKTRFFTAPWSFIWPGLCIIVTVFGFILFGDGLVDVFNPRNTTED